MTREELLKSYILKQYRTVKRFLRCNRIALYNH